MKNISMFILLIFFVGNGMAAGKNTFYKIDDETIIDFHCSQLTPKNKKDCSLVKIDITNFEKMLTSFGDKGFTFEELDKQRKANPKFNDNTPFAELQNSNSQIINDFFKLSEQLFKAPTEKDFNSVKTQFIDSAKGLCIVMSTPLYVNFKLKGGNYIATTKYLNMRGCNIEYAFDLDSELKLKVSYSGKRCAEKDKVIVPEMIRYYQHPTCTKTVFVSN